MFTQIVELPKLFGLIRGNIFQQPNIGELGKEIKTLNLFYRSLVNVYSGNSFVLPQVEELVDIKDC